MRSVEELTREELIALVGAQGVRIAEQDARIVELTSANREIAARLAKLEHLLSRDSANSSMPPSTDGGPGRAAPVRRKKRRAGAGRRKGKQPGARGTHLAWTEAPDRTLPRFPEGCCGCGADLAAAADLGIVDRYQQHEIPPIAVTVTQYEQHQVRCSCGRLHTASRPEGARSGPVGYGPNLAAFTVYLMVCQFMPAHRVVALLESLTGTAPSVGFVHGMLARTATLLAGPDTRIRELIIGAHAVSCDETPLRVGPAEPEPGRVKAEKYLLVACTPLYTYYLLGNRDLATFRAFVLPDLAASGSVLVHDRYGNYDSPKLGEFVHQLCNAHLRRDIAAAAEVYPDAQ